jgi:hypothetical protein
MPFGFLVCLFVCVCARVDTYISRALWANRCYHSPATVPDDIWGVGKRQQGSIQRIHRHNVPYTTGKDDIRLSQATQILRHTAVSPCDSSATPNDSTYVYPTVSFT